MLTLCSPLSPHTPSQNTFKTFAMGSRLRLCINNQWNKNKDLPAYYNWESKGSHCPPQTGILVARFSENDSVLSMAPQNISSTEANWGKWIYVISDLPWGSYHLLWEKINLKSKYSKVWPAGFLPNFSVWSHWDLLTEPADAQRAERAFLPEQLILMWIVI